MVCEDRLHPTHSVPCHSSERVDCIDFAPHKGGGLDEDRYVACPAAKKCWQVGAEVSLTHEEDRDATEQERIHCRSTHRAVACVHTNAGIDTKLRRHGGRG
eukprot:7376958-Prymnesium_polylepis.2